MDNGADWQRAYAFLLAACSKHVSAVSNIILLQLKHNVTI